MTETALADLLAQDLSSLDLVAWMIDGVHFADHLCVVALGIDIDGTRHPLAVVEGSTENTTLASGLLEPSCVPAAHMSATVLLQLYGTMTFRGCAPRCTGGLVAAWMEGHAEHPGAVMAFQVGLANPGLALARFCSRAGELVDQVGFGCFLR